MTFATEGATGVPDETRICQNAFARCAPKAIRMPRVVHSLDDSADDERLAFAATRGKQNVEIVLAILALLKLEKYTVFERLKALCTDEAPSVPGFLAAIDDLFILAESLATLRTTLLAFRYSIVGRYERSRPFHIRHTH